MIAMIHGRFLPYFQNYGMVERCGPKKTAVQPSTFPVESSPRCLMLADLDAIFTIHGDFIVYAVWTKKDRRSSPGGSEPLYLGNKLGHGTELC